MESPTLMTTWPRRRLTRREVLYLGAQVGAFASIGALAAACGSGGTGGTTTALSGNIVMMNYPGWMGAHEDTDFQKLHPAVTIKQVEGLTTGSAAAVAQIHQNAGAYDMSLGALTVCGEAEAAGLVKKVDFSKIPNISHIPDYFRTNYPWGIPTDYGRVGYGYRQDLISERPTSWADIWSLASKYSRKVVFVDFDVDVMGVALRYLGHSVNSTNAQELETAKQALLNIKPHVLAFLGTDTIKPMVQGDAVLTVDYDWDIALAQQKNSNVVWVAPEEGLPGYLEGWFPVKGTRHLDVVEAFMNYALDPKVYGNFINTTGGTYLMPDAEPYINKVIKETPSTKYDLNAIKRVQWGRFLDPAATKLRSQIWEEVKAG